ncbi:hypothetical protein [Nocardia brasiliensis]|uniref:hypothetical protein n=1 Tax=Nocardia brasiliensis TaxID=37326 RepID=UPI0024537B79|nr:hypothetical protein [Nocardia brasiliensis]
MPGNYIPVHQPLQLLVRNEFDTRWLNYGCFDTIDDLAQHITNMRISQVRKRIVHVTINKDTQNIGRRYRMTTIWQGTRLPHSLGQCFPVDDPAHPGTYDTPR